MNADAVDAKGRKYVEVDIFPDGGLKRSFRDHPPDHCVECGKEVRHAWERYFQRNDPEDDIHKHDDKLLGLLLSLTYDCVCGPCGDRLLKKDAI